MIHIYKNTKLYFAVPANIRTGGPQLMHQIVYYFRNIFKMDAYIYAVPTNHPTPVPEDYRIYENPIADHIEDETQNILIVPEIYMTIQLLENYKKIRKIIWWLSVDNFLINRFIFERRIFYYPLRGINKIAELLIRTPIFDINQIALNYYNGYNFAEDLLINKATVNLCSAKHVKIFLEKIGIKNVFYISEFLNEEVLKIKTDETQKENIVAFNGVKGIKFTRKIINYASHLNFIPIRNMSRNEFISLLKKAKVYIDFGNHPGRDRLPREAACLKCCVITNRRGGARLEEDLLIPEEYKFDENVENIPEIVKKIESCIVSYQSNITHFERYRNSIKAEPKKFLEDIKKIFIKVD